MKSLRLLLATIAASVVLLTGFGTVAYATYNPLGGACPAGGAGKGSAACQDSATENNSVDGSGNYKNPVYHIINVAADIIAVIGGIAGVITIIIGGMNYVTSGGNSESITKGKNRIIGALIGLVIIALAWTIVSFGVKLVSK